MKRLLYIFTIAVLAWTGCKKENQPTLKDKICGEWRGVELSADAGIYINFISNRTFELYQKLDSDCFELLKGHWSLDGDILSGTYNDQEPWATSYKVSVAGETLTMVAQDGTDETNVYAKTTIPDGVKENGFNRPYAY
jgi:hypothetical protein